TDAALPKLFQAAEAAGVKICFHLEPFANRNAATTRDAIEYLLTKYGQSPACFRLAGYDQRPVCFVYDSYLTPADEWAEILTPDGKNSIRGTPADTVVIGLWVEQNDGEKILKAG